MSIPYTYYLYHKPTGTKYYGVKFAKNADPELFWKSYFTSSSIIRELIANHGLEGFVFEIRKTFDDPDKAVLWESKVLRRLDVANKLDWANRHIPGEQFRGPETCADPTKEKIRKKLTGIKRSAETKNRLSQSAKRREQQKRDTGWAMPKESIDRALKTREDRIANGIIDPYSSERNKKMAASKRGKKRKYLPDGSFIMVNPAEL